MNELERATAELNSINSGINTLEKEKETVQEVIRTQEDAAQVKKEAEVRAILLQLNAQPKIANSERKIRELEGERNAR